MSTTATPTCDGPRITAYVDGVLPPEARAEVEAHLLSCPSCREQEAFERGLRERMRELSAPEVPPGLEDRVRRRIRRRPLPAAVRWLPLAAGIALALLWGRGAAPFVAWAGSSWWEDGTARSSIGKSPTFTTPVKSAIFLSMWCRGRHGSETIS